MANDDRVNNPGTNEQSTFVPTHPALPVEVSQKNLHDYADVLRMSFQELIERGYTEDDYRNILKDPALTAVTREFGFTVIKTKEFPIKSGLAKADITPWSSWWFPKKDKMLFDDSVADGVTRKRDKLSPLSKYDLYRKIRVANAPSAAAYERKNYDPFAKDWEGLCDAWAIASLLMPEPMHPVTLAIESTGRNKVTFEISDLKALMLKTFEAVDDKLFKYYGQKFTGEENGWIYPDIFPEQFHRFLEVQLFNQHKAFVMDTDPGVEIWNVPVFKANYVINSIPNEPNSVFVRTWVYTAESIKNSNEKSFVGTKEAVREYDYVLQGMPNSSGELVINSGYWVKGPNGIDSRHSHPDYLFLLPERNLLVRKSWNPEIDSAIVDEILSKSY